MMYGKEFIQQDDEEVVIALAELNMRAGKQAMDGCDHKTAYSYLQAALSLLPNNHWERHYDVSLRLHFLVACAANSNFNDDEAELILNKILANTRCIEDMLPSKFLLSQSKCLVFLYFYCIILYSYNLQSCISVFLAQGKANDAYNTCSSALTQLGESIPDRLDHETVKTITAETINMYNQVCGNNDDWLKREMASNNRTIDKFYGAISTASYFCKKKNMLVYFCCKGFQLSLQNGICQHTPLAAFQFALVSMNDENAAVVW
jgi:predicted ATPase